MQTPKRRMTTAALLCMFLFGCSDSQTGGTATRIEVRDGVALCIYEPSKKEYKLGTVNNDQVTLYATYGGVTVSLNDLEETVSSIAENRAEGDNTIKRDEQLELFNALMSQQLPGIWRVEHVEVDGKQQAVREDDPIFLVIRSDKTFRIIKKGRKPAGLWTLLPGSKLALNATNEPAKTAKMRRQPGDKLELIMTDDGSQVLLRYVRTDLTVEPKAVDE
jgi:hypothetical protein